MIEDREAIKHRLTALTPVQRAQLARRLNVGMGNARPTIAAQLLSTKEPPLRIDMDVERRQVAVYPASHGQQWMWFLHQYMADSPVFSSPTAFHLCGTIDLPILEAAFHRLIERRESLRTFFAMEGGQLVQRVASSDSFRLEHKVCLQALAEDRKREAERYIDEAACLPFDLTASPPFRVLLISIEPEQHLLLVVMHHIISDGWSRSNLFEELSIIYGALSQGVHDNLPELPLQYADYSAWQRRRQEDTVFEEHAAYWKSKLAGVPGPLPMPTDLSRPVEESFSGSECSLVIDPELATALKARAQEKNATLFMILLAAFKVLLYRYTGQTDVLVGVPVANRQRPEFEPLIGLFINTLVLRTQVTGDATFEDLLERVKETALEAYEHQEMPFDLVIRLLQVRRDAKQTELFQTLFALQDFPEVDLRLAGLEVTPFPVSTHTSTVNLSLEVRPKSSGLEATIEFNSEFYSASFAQQILRHWHAVLQDIAVNPRRRLTKISLLSPGEKHRLLMEWNRTEREYPQDKLVAELFSEQAERTPNAMAMECEGQSLSYGELHSRAQQLARQLRSLGVQREEMVVVQLERSLDVPVAMLGVLMAGGAFVPLGPELPSERVDFILRDTQARVLLTQTSFLPRLSATQAEVICLDECKWNATEDRFTEPLPAASPQDLAYVIYTSGSTGQPKGVQITQGAIALHTLGMIDFYRLTPSDTMLHFAPLGFDASIEDLLTPLLAGARIIMRGPDLWDPTTLTQRIREFGITVIELTPLYWQYWLASLDAPAVAESLGSLRLVSVGGDAMPVASFERWRDLGLDRVRLINMYGPTEATISALAFDVDTKSHPGERIPIGRPLANRCAYILDSQLEPVPVGVSGELYLGGKGLARGYHNRPELTAEQFLAHPFSADSNARLYKTGDLARYLPDGNIEFLGRVDHQVKIRGFRIELGEIEAVLNRHPQVRTSVVVAREDTPGDKRLVAYVVNENVTASPHALREYLAATLPDYMLPAAFVTLASLPLTPSGKVDRKALPPPDIELGVDKSKWAPPTTSTERALAGIWCEVLGLRQVGIRDNFFELGGHSLLAVQLRMRIITVLHVEVPLRWLFDHPTIESLAKQLEVSSGDLQTTQPLEKADRQKPLVMSFAQQQMWLLHQMLPDQAAYNVPVAWSLSGQVDREKIRRALQLILERHEILRTSLVQLGESFCQQIASVPETPLPWKEISLQGIPPSQQQADLAGLLLEEARRPFDLATAPLWRALWIGLENTEQVLAFTFHHAIADEWSLRLFFQELEEIYLNDGQLQHANLAELPIQYADYSAWQRAQLTGTLLEQLRHYWAEQLRDLPSDVELPADLPQPVQPTGRGATHEFHLTEPVVSEFRALASKEGTTLFTVLLAAFQVWLYRYTQQNDLVVGTPIADRERPELNSMLGFFLNTLPIRARLDASQSFIDVVRQVRQTVLEAFAHSKLPFEQIVDLAVKERIPGQQPLYQVMFVLLEEVSAPLRLDQARSSLMPMETDSSRNDLTLNLRAGAQSIACQLHYATDRFSSARVDSLARHLTELFQSITENPQKPISQLNLIPKAERQQILVEWNRTEQDYRRDRSVSELFTEQAERTPEAVAMECEGQSLSYGELNRHAQQLARQLRSLGVRREEMVVVWLERSLDVPVAMLGVLMAGGAFVPLGPELPSERVDFILRDTQARVLLTQTSFLPRLSATQAEVICLDEFQWNATDDCFTEPLPAASPQDLAYVIYTSGSTGQPKGVQITQGAIALHTLGMIDFYRLTPSDRMLHFLALGFDVAIENVLTPLLAGARIIMRGPELWDPSTLTQRIRGCGITVITLTPLYWQYWLASLDARTVSESLRSLRSVSIGGDNMPAPGLERWRELGLESVQLINVYGPTEATITALAHEVEHTSRPGERIPIGRPLANRCAYILDSQLQPVPVGMAGELYLGGAGLARGYHNRPELTAEQFLAHPFSADSNARVYKTGDLARYLPGGNIEFLGRVDHQVKIRGYRIELGEIEAVLNRHPEVRTSVVVAREDTPGDKRLVAYVVSGNNAASSLREYLAAKLPDYMLPAAFVTLESLPLTPSGKVDRKALPEPDVDLSVDKGQWASPRTSTEMALAGIWCEVLDVKQAGIHDNFFELGGHSILAVRLLNKINSSLSLQVSIPEFFQNPTIEELATVLDRKKHDQHKLIHNNESSSLLFAFQPKGSAPPLFFLHGDWTGGGLYCGLLSQQLGEDRPFHALPPYRSGKTVGFTMEEMAAFHIAAIRKHAPHGPYLLGGYCIGAMVAVEMARQLTEQGEKVLHLLLISPSDILNRWLYGTWPVIDGVGKILKWDVQKKIRTFDLTAVALTRWLDAPTRSKFTSLRRRLGLMKSNSSHSTSTGPESREDEVESLRSLDFALYVLASRTYSLRTISVPTSLYFAEQDPASPEEVNRALEVFPMLTMETVPGDHLSCTSQHTPALADKMKKTMSALSDVST